MASDGGDNLALVQRARGCPLETQMYTEIRFHCGSSGPQGHASGSALPLLQPPTPRINAPRVSHFLWLQGVRVFFPLAAAMRAASVSLLLLLLLALAYTGAGFFAQLSGSTSLIACNLIVLNTSIVAGAQQFDSGATQPPPCSSTMQGSSVLQLVANVGGVSPNDSDLNISLGIFSIALELRSPGGDAITHRYDVAGGARACPASLPRHSAQLRSLRSECDQTN
jgi:hypothetical protein